MSTDFSKYYVFNDSTKKDNKFFESLLKDIVNNFMFDIVGFDKSDKSRMVNIHFKNRYSHNKNENYDFNVILEALDTYNCFKHTYDFDFFDPIVYLNRSKFRFKIKLETHNSDYQSNIEFKRELEKQCKKIKRKKFLEEKPLEYVHLDYKINNTYNYIGRVSGASNLSCGGCYQFFQLNEKIGLIWYYFAYNLNKIMNSKEFIAKKKVNTDLELSSDKSIKINYADFLIKERINSAT